MRSVRHPGMLSSSRRALAPAWALALCLAWTTAALGQNPAGSAGPIQAEEVDAPTAVVATSDLRFGRFEAGATPGTVVLSTTGARTQTGGVLLSANDSGEPASLTVVSSGGGVFALSLPRRVTLRAHDQTLTITGFTNTLGDSGLLPGPATTLDVGGTLRVPAGLGGGMYFGTLSVTADYN